MVKHSTESKTEISSGARVRGTIRGGEDLVVRGRVDGAIEVDAEVSVVAGGIVKANVTARTVVVAGVLVGDVNASDRIEITADGRVVGDLVSPSLRIAEGARFSGGLTIGGERPARAERPRSTIAPREEEWRSAPLPEPVAPPPPPKPRVEEKRTQVTSFVPPKTPGDERRRKRIVVKKRR